MCIDIVDAFMQEKCATLKAVKTYVNVNGLSADNIKVLTINIYELESQIKLLTELRKQIEINHLVK